MKNLIGKTIKNYQILLKVRETPSRILYRACDVRDDRYLALEVLKLDNINHKVLYTALKEQAERNARLSHPNIACVVDSGIQEGVVYFVYNFSPVWTLRRHFNQTFSWNRAARELVSITQTLAYVHQEGVIHGMLEPSSIILDDNHVPFLYDFGMEQIIQNHLLGRSPGAWIKNWKYAYASPEQLAGKQVDHSSDIYSMGIILYEWITGEIPLLDETPLGTLYRRTASSQEEITQKKLEPPEIQELINRCITADPNRRYRSMQELSIVLAREALGLELTRDVVRAPLLAAAQNPVGEGKKWTIIPSLVLLGLMIIFMAFWGIPAIFPGRPVSNPPTATLSPTASIPTVTATTLPTAIPATEQPTAPAGETPTITGDTHYPLREGNTLPPLKVINADNVNRMIMLGVWGVGEINRYALSADGNYVAVASSQGIFIYNTNPWRLEKYLETTSWVSTVEFSPDGKLLASGDLEGLIILWDATTWEEIKKCSGHNAGVIDIAFSPDNGSFASIALDNQLVRWDTARETSTSSLSQSISPASAVSYSADGSFILTGESDWKIRVWDSGNISYQRAINANAKIITIKSIRGSSYVAVGTAGRQVTILDLDEKKSFQPFLGLQADLSSLAVSPDGTIIAAGDINGGMAAWTNEGRKIWQLPMGEKQEVPRYELLSRRQILLFSPDGKTIISGLRSGVLRVLNASTGTEISQNDPINNIVTRFEFSSDGSTGIFQTNGQTIKVWNILQGSKEYMIPGTMMPGRVFSNNGRYFTAMPDPSTIKVYESASGSEIHSLDAENIRTINFLQNDTFLGAWDGLYVRIWSISSGQEIKTIKSLRGDGCTTSSGLDDIPIAYVTSYNYLFDTAAYKSVFCSFHIVDPADTFLFSEPTHQIIVGGNHKLEAYPFANINNVITMEDVTQRRIVHLAAHPDGNLVAAALDDYSIHIWDIASRKEIMNLYGHSDQVTDLQFTGDGRLLVSSSLDGTIRLWGIP